MNRLLVASILLAAPAQAATYWVSPSGVAGRSGADSTTNATTLAWFNANALAGDVCRFKSGIYADPVFPARDGTPTNRIRYYGFARDPGAVRVLDIQFGYQRGDYCTAKWITTTSAFTGCYGAAGQYPVGDSLVNCRSTNVVEFNVLGKACVFDSLRISGTLTGGGQRHWISLFIGGNPASWFSTSNVISNCTFSPTVNFSGDLHVIGLAHAAYNTFVNNTFNVTMQNCSGYFFGVEQYEGYRNTFRGNVWNFVMNSTPGGSHGLWTHRDSSSFNRYVGNTVNVTGSGNLSFMLSNSGSYPGTTGNNYYGNNFIKNNVPQAGTGVFWFYDGTRRDTVEFNVMATSASEPLLSINSGGELNGSVFRHNTFYTGGPTAINFASASASNNPRFASNIFYCLSANAAGSENIRVPSGARLDSAGVFFSRGSSTPGRAISYGGTAGAPGSGGNFGLATQSVWGSPRFADSTYSALDPQVASPGFAVGGNWTDGFAGARPFVGGDATAPATVSNLGVSQSDSTSLVLGWSAPGDDGVNGTASLYDLRWSASPIDASSFAAATPVSPQPVPLSGGQSQSYVMLGLNQGATYHFALRARDDAGNWSGVSNSATGTTTNSDTTPPAAIGDLNGTP